LSQYLNNKQLKLPENGLKYTILSKIDKKENTFKVSRLLLFKKNRKLEHLKQPNLGKNLHLL
jgi:hypothetical protein